MAYFRKVDPRIWTDRRFRSLPERAQLLFLYLLTHPKQTSIGLIYSTAGGIAEERGIERSEVMACLKNMAGMVEYCAEAQAFWLPNWLRYQPFDNHKVAINAVAIAQSLHEDAGEFRGRVLASVAAMFQERFPKEYSKAFPNGIGYHMANGIGYGIQNGSGNGTTNGMPYIEIEIEKEKELEIEGVQGEMALAGEVQPAGPLGPATAAPREAATDEQAKATRTHPFTAVIFPVTGGKTWRMDDALAKQLTIAYPKLDLAQELERAKTWLLASPSRQKTTRGMGRFLSNWASTAEKDRAERAAKTNGHVPNRPRDVIPPPYQFSPDHDRGDVCNSDEIPLVAWMACCEAVESLEAIAGVLPPERTARRPRILLDRFRASLAPDKAVGPAFVLECKRLLSEPDTIRQLLADEVNKWTKTFSTRCAACSATHAPHTQPSTSVSTPSHAASSMIASPNGGPSPTAMTSAALDSASKP